MVLLLRGGLVVTMTFIFLVLSAPVPVLGGRTRVVMSLHEGAVSTGDSDSDSSLQLRGLGVKLGSSGHIDRGFFGRKMLLAAGNPATSVPENDSLLAPAEQLDGHAYSSSTAPSQESASTSPPAPSKTPFAARFAFLFRSLAKGTSPPSTGTPSPGHN